jgi:outer membrane protein assembly factor BamB
MGTLLAIVCSICSNLSSSRCQSQNLEETTMFVFRDGVILSALSMLFVTSGLLRGAEHSDWPQWRYDSARSGESPQALAEDLHLQWVLELPAPQRAWPKQLDDHGKLGFDISYEPIAAGGRLFVPSMVTDSITAYDIASGQRLWRYTTDGPVRLAPTFDQGRVYAGSDDGHLYCLDAASGQLLWRFRAVPSHRTVLGNQRLISVWPVRGAPVVHDGIVYFAAGVWPFEGAYVYALHAETAEVVWQHSGAGNYSSDAYSETARSFSTIAPQGYLAVDGDRLIVSGGRTTPAVFDRHSGELLQFDRVHGRNGGYAVSASADQYLLPVDHCQIRTGTQTYDSREWSEKVDGRVWRLLAADQRLIAVTEQGRIYVFGAEKRNPVVHAYRTEPVPKVEDPWTTRVAGWLKDTGATAGYALMFGIGSGRLLDELLDQSDLRVFAFDPDPDKVQQFRQRYMQAGLYGDRVSVQQGDALSAALPPYIASLIVSEDPGAAGIDRNESFVKALFHPLRPYGGAAYLVLPDDQQQALADAVGRAELDGAVLQHEAGLVRLTRPGALADSDTWTHQYANAANSAYSHDARVQAPLGISWFGGTTNERTLPRHMFGPLPQVAAGRLIILGVDHLSARCVYTGREIWSVELPRAGEFFTSLAHEEKFQPGQRVYFPSHHGANFVGSTYVCTPDSVYVVHQDRCLRLDLATGQTLAVFELPDRDVLHAMLAEPASSYAARATVPSDRRWGYISTWGDYLIVAAYPHYYEQRPDRPDLATPRGENHIVVERDVPWHWNATSSEYLLVMDRQTGQIRWAQQARHGFRHNAIATAAGRTFVIDHVSQEVWNWLQRRGVEPAEKPQIRAIDLDSGRNLWSYDRDVFGTWLSYSEQHDVLIQSGRPGGRSMLPDEPREEIVALRGSDGTELWRRRERFSHGPLALHDAQRRILPVSLDLLTGAPVLRQHPLTGEHAPWSFAANKRCGTQNASQHLLTFRSSMASFHDLVTESGTGNLAGVRAGCTNNMITADGILNVPDYTRTCSCAYQLQTSFGLIHLPDVEMWTTNTYSDPAPGSIRRVGLNFGAPGSRVHDGLLWLNQPPREHLTTPSVPVELETIDGGQPRWFQRHSLQVAADNGEPRWVAANGVEGVRRIRLGGLLPNGGSNNGATYTVRLHFCEPQPLQPGQRTFDVRLQGKTVVDRLDIVQAAGGSNRAYVRQFERVRLDPDGNLTLELVPSDGATRHPLINGLEVRLEE